MPSLFNRFPRITADNGGKFEWAPSADISETDQEYLIRAELPAVKKEDVKVTLDDGMITIHGERKEE
jgi:HSP20 family protein